jgi:hypothetical protein
MNAPEAHMLNLLALALVSPLAELFSSVPDGFVKNRTLLIGFVACLVLAFIAKMFFRSLDTRRLEQREDQQEVSATSGDGPPTFNG